MPPKPTLLPIHVAQSNFMELLAELEVFDSTQTLKDPKIAAQIQVGLDRLCAAGRSASPVTRSAEVQKAIAWLNNPFGYEAHPAVVNECRLAALAYIAQLEASRPKPLHPIDLLAAEQGENTNIVRKGGSARVMPLTPPKPQSDEGLAMEALRQILTIVRSFNALNVPTHVLSDINRINQFCETVLSRQAPVPTSGAVELAEYIAATCIMHNRDAKQGCRVSLALPEAAAIIQQAMDGAARNAVMPTIEKGEGVGIELIGQPVNSLRVWALATQPPAADGKPKTVMEIFEADTVASNAALPDGWYTKITEDSVLPFTVKDGVKKQGIPADVHKKSQSFEAQELREALETMVQAHRELMKIHGLMGDEADEEAFAKAEAALAQPASGGGEDKPKESK